jgi:cytochrome c oxidase subunit 3
VRIIFLYLAVIGAIAAWWLSRQRLMAKPWLEQGLAGHRPEGGAAPATAARVGLGVFLAVVSCMFVLLLSAYLMRMDMGDWRPLPAPRLLWVNTAMLILSSVALQRAHAAAEAEQLDGLKAALLAGSVSALAFLAGQLLAWQQLVGTGYLAPVNPANAFFYLLTGLHGLHLAGGLAVLGLTVTRAWRDRAMDRLRLSVQLCAIYWHFLLAVWIVLFALLLLT